MNRSNRLALRAAAVVAACTALLAWALLSRGRHAELDRALIAAVNRGDKDAVVRLLREGADANTPTAFASDGWTLKPAGQSGLRSLLRSAFGDDRQGPTTLAAAAETRALTLKDASAGPSYLKPAPSDPLYQAYLDKEAETQDRVADLHAQARIYAEIAQLLRGS